MELGPFNMSARLPELPEGLEQKRGIGILVLGLSHRGQYQVLIGLVGMLSGQSAQGAAGADF